MPSTTEQRKAHKAACRSARYRTAHREQIRTSDAAYRTAHREQIRTSDAAYRAVHQEQIKAYCTAHQAERNAYNKAYRAAHKERTVLYEAKRRACKAGLPATLTDSEWEAIKAAYQYKCAYCRRKPSQLTQDHVIPLSKGGGTVKENIVPACGPCNSKKHANLPTCPVSLVLI